MGGAGVRWRLRSSLTHLRVRSLRCSDAAFAGTVHQSASRFDGAGVRWLGSHRRVAHVAVLFAADRWMCMSGGSAPAAIYSGKGKQANPVPIRPVGRGDLAGCRRTWQAWSAERTRTRRTRCLTDGRRPGP